MTTTRVFRPFPLQVVLLLALALLQTAAFAALQPVLEDYQARMKTYQAQVPAITASAQQAAETILAHPEALLDVPYWEQMSFSEELMNRAGGLAHAMPTDNWGRVATKYDIVLLSVRSWQNQRDLILRRVKEYKAKGWTVTIIGSATGKPANLGADFFIDNGAPNAKAEQGRVNVLANTTLGWMWCCEYAAAMSRHGKFPGILYSIAMPGAAEFDAKLQTPDGRHTILDCPKSIPAGELAHIYLKRIEQMIADLRSPHIQQQVQKAADVVAGRLAAGGIVGIAGMGHGIIQEVMVENKTPWKGFRAVFAQATAFKAHLKPGDLLIWMTYCGMNSTTDDYAKYIVEDKLDLVTCYAPDPIWSKNTPPTLAHIDQSWVLPDSEVPIPVAPNAMAPISGVNVILCSRMLDDEVSARLKKLKWHPTGRQLEPIPLWLCDAGGESFFPFESGNDAPVPARKWGFTDIKGKQVTPVQFDGLNPMSEGLAAVRRDGKWGYLNAAGAMAIAPAYDTAASFSGGVALVSAGGKLGYIDKTGKVVVPLQYDTINEPYGMSVIPYAVAKTGKNWEVIDRKGAVLIPAKYDAISPFSDKCVVVKQAGKMGLVSITGEEIAAAKYDQIGRFRRGFAVMQLNGKWGALDGAGKEIVSPKYESILDVSPMVVVMKTGDKWGVISRDGAELIPPKYDQAGRFFDGLSQVRIGAKWGAVDAAGKEVAAPQYDEMKYTLEGMIAVRLNDKWGYIDKTGALVIPAKYDSASNFANGTALVELDGKRNIIDKTGVEIALPKYDYLANAAEGCFKVVRNGKWGFIDKTGKEIVPPKYSYVLSFNNGKALVARGGAWSETAGRNALLVGCKWGLIDKTGHEILAPKYDRIMPFGDGLLAVGVNSEVFFAQP